MAKARATTVVGLGLAQTLAWASSYYLVAILANPIAKDLGIGAPTVFGAFSVALCVSALLGPVAGRLIDAHGGRLVLAGTSVAFAAGLAWLSFAQGTATLFAAWIVLGAAMAFGLYEAAFASLVYLHGQDSRGAITGITLFAGFASTVGWPLTAWLEMTWGWRGACLAWAGLHLLMALPLNLLLPRQPDQTPHSHLVEPAVARPRKQSDGNRAAVLLAVVFAVTWFVSTAMAAHLPRLLQANGVPLTAALFYAGLVGPAQVAGRLFEYGFLRGVHPLLSARLASIMHTLGAGLFLIIGGPAGAAFALLHGAGNGILTIAKGTLPLVFFGPAGYGARQGLLMVPARFAQATAPFFFGLAIDRFGGGALWLSATIGLLAFGALMLLPQAADVPALPRRSERP